MKKFFLGISLVLIFTSLLIGKNPFVGCEPCKYRVKSPCAWEGGALHWYQPVYDGSHESAQAATLSNIGYPPQPRNNGIM